MANTIKRKDNSTGSIGIDTVKNRVIQYNIEYEPSYKVYMLLIKIDDYMYEDLNFNTIEEAKMFCFWFWCWVYDWISEIKDKIKSILDD